MAFAFSWSTPAADYRFTSELPLAVLQLLAPLMEQRLTATGVVPTG